MAQAEYGDPLDVAMLSVPLGLWQQWADFEAKAYETVVNDPRQKFRTLINAGAGRRISENDMPFVERFETVYLLEPDAGRRRLLAESLEKTPRLRENVIGTRLEELDARQVPQFDSVIRRGKTGHASAPKTGHHVGGIGQKNPLVRTYWQGVRVGS